MRRQWRKCPSPRHSRWNRNLGRRYWRSRGYLAYPNRSENRKTRVGQEASHAALEKRSASPKRSRAYITIEQWRAAASVAGDPKMLLFVPVPLADFAVGLLAGRGSLLYRCSVTRRLSQIGKGLCRLCPICGQRQIIAERILLSAAFLVWRNARQPVRTIQEGTTILVSRLNRRPMSLHEIKIISCKQIVANRVQKLKRQVHVDVHVRISAPVQPPSALRQLVPDHAGFVILILENEFEFLASPVVLPRSQEGANGEHSVPGEKPVILRTSSPAGGAISGDQAAS